MFVLQCFGISFASAIKIEKLNNIHVLQRKMPPSLVNSSLKCDYKYVLSAAERRGTPVLLSAMVSDNSGNSPQMAAPRRSREIDQSTQHFHVGCDNRCLLGNEYGGLHGRDFLGRTLIILILTNHAVFVTLSVGKIPPLAQPSLF